MVVKRQGVPGEWRPLGAPYVYLEDDMCRVLPHRPFAAPARRVRGFVGLALRLRIWERYTT